MCVLQHGAGTREGKQGHKTRLEGLSWVSLAGVDPEVNSLVLLLLPGENKLQEKAWLQRGTKKQVRGDHRHQHGTGLSQVAGTHHT